MIVSIVHFSINKKITFVQMNWDGALMEHKKKWNEDEPEKKK